MMQPVFTSKAANGEVVPERRSSGVRRLTCLGRIGHRGVRGPVLGRRDDSFNGRIRHCARGAAGVVRPATRRDVL